MDQPDVQWLPEADYAETLDRQERLVESVQQGGRETILLVEHRPVYTIGRTRDQSSLRSPFALPHPVFETNRGGQATWHGPGQLVAYPILDLGRRGRDLHRYLRFLEEIILRICARHEVTAQRREGLTGVWVQERKIASLGVGVRKWVAMHGLALNVNRTSLAPFQHITPCGISGVEMTSLESECGRPLEVQSVGHELADLLLENLASFGPLAAPTE